MGENFEYYKSVEGTTESGGQILKFQRGKQNWGREGERDEGNMIFDSNLVVCVVCVCVCVCVCVFVCLVLVENMLK